MPKSKGKKKKRVSVPEKKKGRRPSSYIMPDWMHWLITIVLISIISVCAYFLYLRPYLYRLRPCKGTKEYGVCLPSGFLYYGIDVSHHQGTIDWGMVAQSSVANGLPIKFVMMKATEEVLSLIPVMKKIYVRHALQDLYAVPIISMILGHRPINRLPIL